MGFVIALALEALLVLLLLTLGSGIGVEEPRAPDFVSFKATNSVDAETPEPEKQPPTEASKPEAKTITKPQVSLAPTPPVPEEPAPIQKPVSPAWAVIPLSPSQMAASDISGKSAGSPVKPKQVYGPADTGSAGDSQRVSGTAPNGEPLYRATWYREPSQSELAGYLSTASGPGWALVSCKTVPDFRVEDCVLESEYPRGSNMGRAVLAATWQFRVRPPRVGGRPLVGAWVRIRIEYARR